MAQHNMNMTHEEWSCDLCCSFLFDDSWFASLLFFSFLLFSDDDKDREKSTVRILRLYTVTEADEEEKDCCVRSERISEREDENEVRD